MFGEINDEKHCFGQSKNCSLRFDRFIVRKATRHIQRRAANRHFMAVNYVKSNSGKRGRGSEQNGGGEKKRIAPPINKSKHQGVIISREPDHKPLLCRRREGDISSTELFSKIGCNLKYSISSSCLHRASLGKENTAIRGKKQLKLNWHHGALHRLY